MDYYDEIHDLMNRIKTFDDEKEILELEKYAMNESSKEIFLIINEWVSIQEKVEFSIFEVLIGFFSIVLNGLKKSNPLITYDCVSVLYRIAKDFEEKERTSLFNRICNRFPTEESQGLICLKILLADVIDPELESRFEIPQDSYSKLNEAYKLALARCACVNPNKYISIGHERLFHILMESKRNTIRLSGISFAKKIQPSCPRDLFKSIVRVGPFLDTLESAQESWNIARGILSGMNDEEKYHCLRLALEDPEICESARAVITHEIIREMFKKGSGPFQSPLLPQLTLLIVPPSYISSPVSKIESVITALNFIRDLLILDRKYHCYRVFGNPSSMQIIHDIIEKMKLSVTKAKKDNNKPKETILKGLKKSNLGEKMTLEDVDQIMKENDKSIVRISYAIGMIEEVIQGQC